MMIAGSRAFGVHRSDSGVDAKGVAVPPSRWLHGCMNTFEQANDPQDIASFAQDLREGERAVIQATELEGTGGRS